MSQSIQIYVYVHQIIQFGGQPTNLWNLLESFERSLQPLNP